MTAEGTINFLKTEFCWEDKNTNDCEIFLDKNCEACEIKVAIEAVEKQIPKKPINVEDKYWACPCCGNLLMVKWITYPVNPVPLEAGRNHCEECGQAIDWSEEE